MDKIDSEFFELLKDYKIGKTYHLKDITYENMEFLTNRLYIFAKRKYVIIYNKDVYAEITGKPCWWNMSFKVLANSYIQEYYLSSINNQLKLDL